MTNALIYTFPPEFSGILWVTSYSSQPVKRKMATDFTSLLPAVLTFAAALVGGGIARSNLIATKETKVSEFRQAWINSLRDELATLFSNNRTLVRAVQEDRSPDAENPSKFHFSQDKITTVRHGAAETYYKIKLRLNREQDDHKELLRLLFEMMAATQRYVEDPAADVQLPLSHVEKASDQSEKVLKNEWRTVKGGEDAYRTAVKTTSWVLIISGAIWALIAVGIPVYAFHTKGKAETGTSSSSATLQRPTRTTSPAIETPKSGQPSPATRTSPATK